MRTSTWDSLDQEGTCTAEILQGDHPVAPSETFDHHDHDIERDSLYVRDEVGQLVRLRPFLVRLTCPRCGTRSTFHPDRRLHSVLQLKAIDHGHTTDGTTNEPALRRVGYMDLTTASSRPTRNNPCTAGVSCRSAPGQVVRVPGLRPGDPRQAPWRWPEGTTRHHEPTPAVKPRVVGTDRRCSPIGSHALGTGPQINSYASSTWFHIDCCRSCTLLMMTTSDDVRQGER